MTIHFIAGIAALSAIGLDSGSLVFSRDGMRLQLDRTSEHIMVIDPSGDALKLTGNVWVSTPLPIPVGGNTVMSFEFQSELEGEVQGFGLMAGDEPDSEKDRRFLIHGREDRTDWEESYRNRYHGRRGEWIRYEIPLGQHFAGTARRIVFFNEDRVPDPDSSCAFRRVTFRQESGLASSKLTSNQILNELLGVSKAPPTPMQRALLWNYPFVHVDSEDVALRMGRWKARFYPQVEQLGPWGKRRHALYNIEEDPSEKNDLSSEYPEIYEAMRQIAGAMKTPPAIQPQTIVANESSGPRPNVVWIIADDLGYGDLSCYGSPDLRTPYIDRLATDGVRCTSFYVSSPVCSPSRATLLTGRRPERLDLTQVLVANPPSAGLSPDEYTIAEAFHDAGYATGLVGKWHLGNQPIGHPLQQGFDEYFGHLTGLIDYFTHMNRRSKQHDLWEGTNEVFRTGYSTDLFTDRAIEFVKDHRTDPFFLMLCYNAPHYAYRIHQPVLQAPESYIKREAADPSRPRQREQYRAMVACMDDGVGQVLDTLDALDLADNTIVIFLSDNGAALDAGGCNLPLSGGKSTVTEGGIRVPCIVRWPGRVPAGRVNRNVLAGMDLFPSLLSWAGITPPQPLFLDGIDVTRALEQTPTDPAAP